jgi:predicted DNA-binding transcriptional regulator AlpA
MTKATTRQRLPMVQVAARYMVSRRTVERWEEDETLQFPKPFRIYMRKYWSLDELELWERKRAARR